ncbi:MAG: NYN domain-containing protein [Candidatus Paceibacterota bacterium]|jgi:uncharacterized LabA/DUF88 family protein
MEKSKTNIYIDGANLHRAAKELHFEIDYKKFYGWLRQKYNPDKIYLFMGLIPSNAKLYNYLQESGFSIIFKETVSVGVDIKGNCDAELVLHSVSDFYTNKADTFILITGDGDFACLVKFLLENKKYVFILAPHNKKCSFLLRKSGARLVYLNDLYHKFQKTEIKEKAPNEVGTSSGSLP